MRLARPDPRPECLFEIAVRVGGIKRAGPLMHWPHKGGPYVTFSVGLSSDMNPRPKSFEDSNLTCSRHLAFPELRCSSLASLTSESL